MLFISSFVWGYILLPIIAYAFIALLVVKFAGYMRAKQPRELVAMRNSYELQYTQEAKSARERWEFVAYTSAGWPCLLIWGAGLGLIKGFKKGLQYLYNSGTESVEKMTARREKAKIQEAYDELVKTIQELPSGRSVEWGTRSQLESLVALGAVPSPDVEKMIA